MLPATAVKYRLMMVDTTIMDADQENICLTKSALQSGLRRTRCHVHIPGSRAYYPCTVCRLRKYMFLVPGRVDDSGAGGLVDVA